MPVHRQRAAPLQRSLEGKAPAAHYLHPHKQPLLQPLEMTRRQAAFLSDTMEELKERAAKRQRVGRADGSTPVDSAISDSESSCDSFDIFDGMREHPHAVQFAATPGGLITHWNEAFADLTRQMKSSRGTHPLTIFDLVEPSSLSSLYGMLAMSLHDVNIIEYEELSFTRRREGCERTPPSHLSITLPCRMFKSSSCGYDVTVVFANDVASSRRCFLGVLSPTRDDGVCRGADFEDDASESSSHASTLTSSRSIEEGGVNAGDFRDADEGGGPRQWPRGKIVRVDDDLLCRTILGPGDFK